MSSLSFNIFVIMCTMLAGNFPCFIRILFILLCNFLVASEYTFSYNILYFTLTTGIGPMASRQPAAGSVYGQH